MRQMCSSVYKSTLRGIHSHCNYVFNHTEVLHFTEGTGSLIEQVISWFITLSTNCHKDLKSDSDSESLHMLIAILKCDLLVKSKQTQTKPKADMTSEEQDCPCIY